MDLAKAGLDRRLALGLIGSALVMPRSALGETTMSDQTNVQILAQLTGDTYRTYRDGVLSGPIDFTTFDKDEEMDEDWRLSMTIAILKGWGASRSQFLTVSETLQNAIPSAGSRPRAGGGALTWDNIERKAHNEYDTNVLPLAWEAIAKFHETLDAQMITNHLAVISGVPDAASVSPVAYLMETSENRLVRERAAYCLSRLPRAPVEAALVRLDQRSNDLGSIVQTARDLLD